MNIENKIMNYNLLSKPLFFMSILTFYVGILHAEWDPENCFIDRDVSALKVLNEQNFCALKSNITKYLEGSWCSPEKINLIMDVVFVTKPTVCVEVGAFTGSTILPVAATLKYANHGKIIAIDAWSNSEVTKNLESDDPNKAWWSSVNMKEVYTTFQGMINQWSIQPYCTVMQKTSDQAANQIHNIDFLHLDGDYSEAGSVQDVMNYLPKVKTGGYILLSNIFVSVNGKLPKMKAFSILYDECEMVSEIENGNVILFKKL